MITPRIVLFVSALFLWACGSSERPSYDDTPVMGNVQIVVDESFQPLVEAELQTFMKLYKYATVRADYLPESEVFKRLLNDDSVRIAIVSRDLTAEEAHWFECKKIIPRRTPVAIDAVALVLNKQNPDTLLTFDRLQSLFNGEIKRWSELSRASLLDSVRIVFDKNGSGNTRFLKEQLLGAASFPPNCYATNSNAAVIDYVSQTRGAIGVVSVNWISDREDPEVERFLDKVNIVAVSATDDTVGTEFFGPYQAYIALKKYPLTRKIQVISREGRNGLGTGFASFFAGDSGQRLVRLSGMLPANMPVRIIHVSE
jgi:phosphate transport system substrate-binding protein